MIASISIASWAGGVQAQIAPPEPHRTIDANGVNLLSGTMEVRSPTISVGPAGKGGLSYSATFDTAVQSWRHSVSGSVNHQSTQVQPTYPYATATIMGESFDFAKIDATTYRAVDNLSASIVFAGNVPTVTLGDGSVAQFTGGLNGGDIASNRGLISSLTRPSGEVITFTYASIPSGTGTATRIQSVTNNYGYQLHFDYDAGGTFQKVTALNNTIDACAPAAATCTYSRTWPSLTFGVNGTQQTVTDALGRVTRLNFVSTFFGQISSLQSPAGRTVTMAYGTSGAAIGKITSIAVSGGGTWTYAYATQADPSSSTINHNTASVTDPLSHTRVIGIVTFPDQYEHGTQRMEYDQDAAGRKTKYGWTNNSTFASYQLTSVTQPEGDYSIFNYDDRGNIASVIKTPKSGSGLSPLTMSAVYPTTCSNAKTCNKPISVTDSRNATTDFTYNATHGGVETVTQPVPISGAARPQARTSYTALYAYYKKGGASTVSAADSPVYLQTSTSQCVTGSSCAGASNELLEEAIYSRSTSGLATNLQPDALRKKAGDGSDLISTSYTYSDAGDLLNVTDPLGRNSHTEYDAMRQTIGSVTPDPDDSGILKPRAQLVTYDADGQVTSIKTGTVSSWNSSPTSLAELKDDQTHYDALGRKDQTRLVVGGQIQALVEYSYDAANRPLCTAVRMNKAVFSTAPVDACTERAAGSDGRDRIAYTSYDSADRAIAQTSGYGVDPIVDRAITYTDNGKVLSETDGENNKTVYSYDGFDRLKTVTYPSVTKGSLAQNAGDYEQYDYDANDNRVSQRRRDNNSITWTYDALNRQQTKSLAATAATAATSYSYGYDNLGRITSAIEGGRTITSVYDVHGRLKSETGPLGAVGYVYDAASRRVQLSWPEGISLGYEYDNTDAPTYIKRATTVIAQFAYDDLGRRSSVIRTGAATNYGYDGALRLSSLAHDLSGTTEDVTYGFVYNVAGQIKQRTISNSAYIWNGAYTVDRAYGANGLNQMTSTGATSVTYSLRGNLASDGATTYKYDLENRLRGTVAGASLIYDPLGRLYEATTAAGVVTRYLYDGPNIIAEYSGANVLLRRYAFGLGSDELLARFDGASLTPKWLFADPQGSIVAAADSAGAILTDGSGKKEINTYDEYGIPGAGNKGLFQYTGQAWLADLSLYHYKARAYSPTLGRFLQTDPTGYEDGLNWYAYVGNDPINQADPEGTQAVALLNSDQNYSYISYAPTEGGGVDRGSKTQDAGDRYSSISSRIAEASQSEHCAECVVDFHEKVSLPILLSIIPIKVPGLGRAGSVTAGQGGRFADLLGTVGDNLTAHHIPQAALKFTTRADGGAIVMTGAEHAATRTFAYRGAQTLAADAGKSFRSVLARDIRDVRSIVGSSYNKGLQDVLKYYRNNFPSLMAKP